MKIYHLEKFLLDELRWLDGVVVSRLDEDMRSTIMRNGIFHQQCNYSQYYWNDMMRKLLVARVVPLCIKSGEKVKALQYLNVASNRIYQLVDRVAVSRYWNGFDVNYYTMKDYRKSSTCINSQDYSNEFFQNLDSLGLDAERAAKALYQLCRFKSVVSKYPKTDMTEYVRGHCDKLYDY